MNKYEILQDHDRIEFTKLLNVAIERGAELVEFKFQHKTDVDEDYGHITHHYIYVALIRWQ